MKFISILLIIFLTNNSATQQNEPKHAYYNKAGNNYYCIGNGLTKRQVDNYEILRLSLTKIYDFQEHQVVSHDNNKNNDIKCTVVYGDVYLYDLKEEDDLEFLNHIKIIYGRLYIEQTDIKKIIFKNLQVIQLTGKYDKQNADLQNRGNIKNTRLTREKAFELYGKTNISFPIYPGHIIRVANNEKLKILAFPKLRVIKVNNKIKNGGVFLTGNNLLCPMNVNWESLGVKEELGGFISCLGMSAQAYQLSESKFDSAYNYWKWILCHLNELSQNTTAQTPLATPKPRYEEHCSGENDPNFCGSDCNPPRKMSTDVGFSGIYNDPNQNKCYTKNICQTPSYLAKFCASGQINDNLTQCCPNSCIGGCYNDPLLNNQLVCYACNLDENYYIKMSSDGRHLRCVEKCADVMIYNHLTNEKIVQRKGILDGLGDPGDKNQLNLEDRCIGQCPCNMEEEDGMCLDLRTYKETKTLDEQERKTTIKEEYKIPENCKTKNAPITSQNIKKYTNCTKIHGSITMVGDVHGRAHISLDKSKDGFEEYGARPILKSDLKAFEKVKEITGYLFIQTNFWILGSNSIGDAFPNLETIWNKRSNNDPDKRNPAALEIFICDPNIHLGLKKLTKIGMGGINIYPGICNMDQNTIETFHQQLNQCHRENIKNGDISLFAKLRQDQFYWNMFFPKNCQMKYLEAKSKIFQYYNHLKTKIDNNKIGNKTRMAVKLLEPGENEENIFKEMSSYISGISKLKSFPVVGLGAVESKELSNYIEIKGWQHDFRNKTKCHSCHKNCKSCWLPEDVSHCIECSYAFSLTKNECVDLCSNSEYLQKRNDGNSPFENNNHNYVHKNFTSISTKSDNLCLLCDKNCQKCKGPSNSYSDCENGCLGAWYSVGDPDSDPVRCFVNESDILQLNKNENATQKRFYISDHHQNRPHWSSKTAFRAAKQISASKNNTKWNICPNLCQFGCFTNSTIFFDENLMVLNCKCPVLILKENPDDLILQPQNFECQGQENNNNLNFQDNNYNFCNSKGYFNTSFSDLKTIGYSGSVLQDQWFFEGYDPIVCGPCEYGCEECIGPSGCDHFNFKLLGTVK